MPDNLEDADDVINGVEIRFMWDYTVTVPLWDEEGLLPDEPAWLHRVLGLSAPMIDRLTRWGEAMKAQDAIRDPGSRERRTVREGLRRQGKELADDLQRELGARYTVTYTWW